MSVEGDREVVYRLQNAPKAIRKRLYRSVQDLTIRLQKEIKEQKLSGQVLKVQTGTLFRSIEQRVFQNQNGVTGIAFTNVDYGRVHEYGFNGDVRAYLRRIKEAWGRSITPKTINVRAHKMVMPVRSFARSALADLESSGAIQQEIEKAIGGI
jgi:hypothetical protein